jgi:hypothetical protein
MKQFIHDMIHMTEGEKLIHYWPLWLVLVVMSVIYVIVQNRKGD